MLIPVPFAQQDQVWEGWWTLSALTCWTSLKLFQSCAREKCHYSCLSIYGFYRRDHRNKKQKDFSHEMESSGGSSAQTHSIMEEHQKGNVIFGNSPHSSLCHRQALGTTQSRSCSQMQQSQSRILVSIHHHKKITAANICIFAITWWTGWSPDWVGIRILISFLLLVLFLLAVEDDGHKRSQWRKLHQGIPVLCSFSPCNCLCELLIPSQFGFKFH